MKRSRGVLISFAGWSGSGKTTYIETCISLLKDLGYRVYAVKSTHLEVPLDTPGTDSHRFKQAGASGVCFLTGNGSAVFLEETENQVDHDRLTGFFPEADVILAEGYHGKTDLLYEIAREGASTEGLKNRKKDLDGIITDSVAIKKSCEKQGLPVFSLNDPGHFIDSLAKRFK